jgi:hypothetical protein
MARQGPILRSSVFLLAANLCAGGLHYLFQVRAAAQLEPAAYGALNGWMAYLSVALFFGAAAQIASNFFPWTSAGVRRAGWLTIAATLLSLAWLGFATDSGATGPTPLEFGIACTILGTLQQWTLGQFQARTWFVWMGSALVLAAVMKWLGTFLPLFSTVDLTRAYFWAFPLSYGASCLLQSVVMLSQAPSMTRPSTGGMTSGRAWLGALTLALAMALLPQLDMLNLRGLQSDYALGQYARTSLFAKAIFFAALTLLQVALPHHVLAHKGFPSPEYARIQWLERLGLFACVLGSFVCAACAPWLTSHFLGFQLSAEQRLWVLLSCLALTALYGHLQAVQVRCATGEWQHAVTRLFAVAALYPVTQTFLRHVSVSLYLEAAVAYYVAIEVVGRIHGAMRQAAATRQVE